MNVRKPPSEIKMPLIGGSLLIIKVNQRSYTRIIHKSSLAQIQCMHWSTNYRPALITGPRGSRLQKTNQIFFLKSWTLSQWSTYSSSSQFNLEQLRSRLAESSSFSCSAASFFFLLFHSQSSPRFGSLHICKCQIIVWCGFLARCYTLSLPHVCQSTGLRFEFFFLTDKKQRGSSAVFLHHHLLIWFQKLTVTLQRLLMGGEQPLWCSLHLTNSQKNITITVKLSSYGFTLI